MAIKNLIDDYFKHLDMLDQEATYRTVITTIRLPEDVRFKLDLIGSYLGMSRSSLMGQVLTDAADEGIKALEGFSRARDGGQMLTVDQELSAGLAAIRSGLTPTIYVPENLDEQSPPHLEQTA